MNTNRLWSQFYPHLILAAILVFTFGVVNVAQAQLSRLPKEIYGVDDRRDVFEETSQMILNLAKGVVAIMNAQSLQEEADGSFTFLFEPVDPANPFLCAEEPFSNQPTLSFCSGFVVGLTIVVTNGHCIRNDDSTDFIDLTAIRIVFGYEMIDASTVVDSAPATHVYSLAANPVEAWALDGDRDFAVLRLDRPISGPDFTVLSFPRSGPIALGTPIGIIGHPLGLPKKIAFGQDTVVQEVSDSIFFIGNIDGSGGNSGSPIFNATTGAVEGIYTFSLFDDTEFDDAANCFRMILLDDAQGSGGVVRSSVIPNVVGIGEGEGEGDGKPSSITCSTAPGLGPSSARSDSMFPLLLVTAYFLLGSRKSVVRKG